MIETFKKMNYQAYFQTVNSITASKKQQMAAIYFQYYQGSDLERFYQDLDNKNEVLFLEQQGQMVGFTTIEFYSFQQKMIVYSGDTIVMPEHWQQQSLHSAWIQRMGKLKQDNPTTPIYWFLLVKGYRTYKYLIVFAKSFYPHWDGLQPELKQLADQLAVAKFVELYNVRTGVVECPSEYGYLKEDLTDIASHEQQKKSSQFFLSKNPYYYKGHELVCLCELSADNLQSRAQKLFLDTNIEYRNE
ncbi:hypothetical protein MTZ49_13590 [Entomomonas sp. E2T0]|uniref:hypothetical protein n=1 Tax=Entomomonas sp. E2T0 TaxID=2930213 RepID=UPI0022282B4B|nr:hypothetical protein [Entomomonas sp. E2T0]UYZ83613.1 hypothetical protein MTZ49_13590 [Entomomonas sp. E2T0]